MACALSMSCRDETRFGHGDGAAQTLVCPADIRVEMARFDLPLEHIQRVRHRPFLATSCSCCA
jgi:hypothetical protein